MTEMFPPDFTDAESWVRPIVDTIAMSIEHRLRSFCRCLWAFWRREIRHRIRPSIGLRGILNVFRSIPELIMGIVFVAAVGFELPGVLALGLHSIGMVGKFFWRRSSMKHRSKRHIIESWSSPGILPQVMPPLRT